MCSAGDGHFSPLGGYHELEDMVLILDTARFKYPPHWVPLAQLYQAMASVDAVTGKARGFIKLAANDRLNSVMFTLSTPNRYAIDSMSHLHHFQMCAPQVLLLYFLTRLTAVACLLLWHVYYGQHTLCLLLTMRIWLCKVHCWIQSPRIC